VAQGPQQLFVGGEAFTHTYDAEAGVHTFEDDAGVYRFKEWMWGAKNAASNASVVLDQQSGGFQIDTARFNEAMLAASLVEATVAGQALDPGPAALRALKASLGDKLLGLAQWVNGLLTEAAPPEPRFDPRNETYHLALDEESYVLREWTWGEKNAASSRSVVYDAAADTFGVDMAFFNELMLQATLVEAPFDLTSEALRRLPASKGDALLAAAQRINGLAATEKKRS
jgi:hypothetical protein